MYYHRFVVEVPPLVYERLGEVARAERRSLKDQAAVLLSSALMAGSRAGSSTRQGSGQPRVLRPGPEAA